MCQQHSSAEHRNGKQRENPSFVVDSGNIRQLYPPHHKGKATMIHSEIPMPFPHSGAKAFEQETGKPLTILRRNTDGSFFCRRDDAPRPSWGRGGRASGNITLEAHEVVETLAETAVALTVALPESSRTLAGKPRQSRRAKRPARGKVGE